MFVAMRFQHKGTVCQSYGRRGHQLFFFFFLHWVSIIGIRTILFVRTSGRVAEVAVALFFLFVCLFVCFSLFLFLFFVLLFLG